MEATHSNQSLVDPNSFHSPFLFFNNGIGDYILTLPSIRALAHIFKGNLSIICREGFYKHLFDDLQLRQIVEVKYSFSDGVRIFDADKVARQVKHCDLFISATPWHSRAVDTLLNNLNPKLSVGYFSAFDIGIPRDYSWHAVDMAFQLAKAFASDIKLEEFSTPLKLQEGFLQLPKHVRQAIPDQLRLLIVHSDTESEKLWSDTKFVRVIDDFLERQKNYLAFIVGLKKLPTQDSHFPDRYVDYTRVDILKTFGLIALSDLFLGVDSCMLHVADISRVPGVGLFGPTDYHHFGFRFAEHRHVSGNGTMANIDINEVSRALESLVS